ncbi:uncharacterized protein LOC124949832 [Vespa velutina]|uniref:uncharacterized protein LOC124949832 n=1 Tax=Vespa velutina TaxID=202808 RepID=UPI001FB38DF8|nr:uncharacterized protein LOC124949832 [Vespa velutina]
MSKITLYSQLISPPCRAVLMVGEAIGIDFDIHEINLFNYDQQKEDFVKLNPQHTIPTIQDNDFILWDSHVIAVYLIEKYAADDSLYPKDLQLRATLWQRLIFDASVLFHVLKRIFKSIKLGSEKTISKLLMDELEEALGFFEKLLEGKQWLVGDSYTIADICNVSTVSSLTVIVQWDKYPNIQAWLKRCEEQLPGYEKYNVPGSKQVNEIFQQKLMNACLNLPFAMSLKTFVNKSVPTLYMTELSPPVRSVLMTAYIIGLPLYKKEVNLISGEQRTAAYLKMNPQGTVPLLQDKDYYVWDSHAISGYLVHEYGKSDSLYPKDSRKRAMVDQRLHFDTGTLYPEFRNVVYPVIAGEKIITKEKINRVENVYKTFDSILANAKTKWLAGDTITIADLCNVATLSTLELFVPPTGKYHHLENWFGSCKKEIPGYEEVNQQGLDKLVNYVKILLTK